MKIYDCFTFYNELDILDLHLAELYSHVDHFVIVEADTTFTNKLKPYNFELNKDRYTQYMDKIIYVKVDDMPLSDNAWSNETFQRNAIMRGLVDAGPDDICLIGDVDEILRPETVDQVRADHKNIMGFRMPYFNFKFNYMLVNNQESYYVWTTGCRRKFLEEPDAFRSTRFGLHNLGLNYEDADVKLYEHAGWHFTYQGSNATIRDKIQNFAHTELNREDVLEKIDVDAMIAKGVGFNPEDPRPFIAVKLDDYFPRTIYNNLERYADKIITTATKSAHELFS